MMHHKLFGSVIAVSMAATMACTNSPTPPTAPNPPSGTGAPAGSSLKATAPTIVSPSGGVEIQDLSPVLTINNAAPQYVPDLPLSYIFEVFDSANQVVYRSGPIGPGSDGRTSHEVDLNLNTNEVHTWRSWAVYQGLNGPISATASFKTFNRFGVSCAHTGTEVGVVQCRKAQYGKIPHDSLPEFLERVAYDLNRMGAEHRPYGRLLKDTGNNCHGFACDIICSGNGGGQRQWDILEDEDVKQGPQWNRVPEISVRHCAFVE